MTHPSQHLPEELLVDYVNGRASEAVALAVACHVTLCGRCQGQVDGFDAIAGATLETAPGLPLREGVLEKLLARLDTDDAPDEQPATWTPPPACEHAAESLGLPRPLLRYLDCVGGLKWQHRLPGVGIIPLSLAAHAMGDIVVRLVRFRAGLVVPLHSHEGPEYTVIFTGALDDAGVRYGRGDVCVRDAGDRHVQRILPGEDCVVLAVNEGPLVPLTWAGRLMQLLGDRKSD